MTPGITGMHGMKPLGAFDDGAFPSGATGDVREAVRAVIIRGDTVAMVYTREGFFKFPGGGIEKGETHTDTLVRETAEETGIVIDRGSVCPLGYIIERRANLYDNSLLFTQVSYYYTAAPTGKISPRHLSARETADGYTLEWVSIRKAYETDSAIGQSMKTAFLLREARVLGILCGEEKAGGE